ncbi:hypothetical protein QBC45DRAFT_402145 [Copromyces sp. CBS 386.78]|nr:hypothetical protein QBC45DRAFT_402145 [Copromyces sp. CBS 386.78]
MVFGACELEVSMPVLLNRPGAPLPCREPPAEFETVNGHFSAQVHASFNALHDLGDMADKPSSDDVDLCRPDEWLRPVIFRTIPVMMPWIVFRLSRHPFDPKYQVEQATYYILESGHHECGLVITLFVRTGSSPQGLYSHV